MLDKSIIKFGMGTRYKVITKRKLGSTNHGFDPGKTLYITILGLYIPEKSKNLKESVTFRCDWGAPESNFFHGRSLGIEHFLERFDFIEELNPHLIQDFKGRFKLGDFSTIETAFRGYNSKMYEDYKLL